MSKDNFALDGFEPSLTQQHFAEECDINEILRRSAVSGQLPINSKVPMYGDFTRIPKSLGDAFALIKQANDLFAALPWNVRERFGNNPERMIQFLNDPANRDEAIRLGLVNAPPKKDDVKQDTGTSGPGPASPPAGGPAGVGSAQ